ncbi:MAG: arginine N-succinyltransferase [Phycisphaerae bacterium]|nr:arginine N-succinyltransferase [Phycisphaerae bacterium]
MFLIRQSKPEDASTLVKMAKMVYFINLPPSEQLILEKVDHSARCFRKLTGDTQQPKSRSRKAAGEIRGYSGMEHDSDFFMFSLEDATHGGVIGTSQVRAHQGGPGNPNWSFRLSEKKHYSPSLRFGTTHTVGQLYADETGPTEIGGLIIQPSYRGHAERPGRFLAFVRFHFIGLYRNVFADRIIAEMMGPVSAEGDNPFWDAFGRKFVPVKFAEADRFCQHNRAFISELLPKEEIYLSLMPLEVQNAVGVVGRETLPARRLLESLGFAYRGFVDPFDGGPHLDVRTDDVSLVRHTRRIALGKPVAAARCQGQCIISTLSQEHGLRATQAPCEVGRDELRVPGEYAVLIGASKGKVVGFTPLVSHMSDPTDTHTNHHKKPGRTRVRTG